jgi:hypothetical protein
LKHGKKKEIVKTMQEFRHHLFTLLTNIFKSYDVNDWIYTGITPIMVNAPKYKSIYSGLKGILKVTPKIIPATEHTIGT